jgi:bifunctional UDP-N-acetylglucosamine pyrophosphorylase/glucosamine-1-phosphate N-acetyltransferase
MATPIDVVIMAAGKGTRMKSALPKVLHRLGGRALLSHVLQRAAELSARQAVVITGHGKLIVFLARHFPGLTRAISRRLVRGRPEPG